MADFRQYSNFNKNNNFTGVVIGADAEVTELDLNEMQEILKNNQASVNKLMYGDGILGLGTMSYAGGTFTYANDSALVNGVLVPISSLTLASLANGDKIYLDTWVATLAYTDTVKTMGNQQAGTTEVNKMLDSRINAENSRRLQLQYTLTKTNSGTAGHTYLQLGHITNGAFILDARTITPMTSMSAPITASVGFGMNSKVVVAGKTMAMPSFKIGGQSYVNLFGKDGNCENVSKWNTWQGTSSLDTTNKLFGGNGIKVVTSTTSYSALYKTKTMHGLDVNKYYLFSAYVKNGNLATGIKLSVEGIGLNTTPMITDTTKFTRIALKITPTDMITATNFDIWFGGTAVGQYGYVDGIMVNEITASEYALDVATLMAKYPYVDSYACTMNPYIQVIHDNLVRNGNGEEGLAYWKTTSNASLALASNGFTFTATATWEKLTQTIKVKPNTDYFINATIGASLYIGVWDTSGANMYLGLIGGTFNSGNNTEISVGIMMEIIGSSTVNSLMLVEGTTAPASYLPFRSEELVVKTLLTSDDSVTVANGEVSGLVNWKHRTLYGKDVDWRYNGDAVGFKKLYLTLNPKAVGGGASGNVGIKSDGKILVTDLNVASADTHYVVSAGDTYYVAVADTETGWAETIAPNDDEVKAFMNGWKALKNNGTRYTVWASSLVADPKTVPNAFPPGTTTTMSGTQGSGTTVITVADASIFKTGDGIWVYDNNPTTVQSISGNNITLVGSLNLGANAGTVVTKVDANLVTYCKYNVVSGYEGYQLHYKLAKPEILGNLNAGLEGVMPLLNPGDNYIYLDTGMVLAEQNIPVFNNTGYWWINSYAPENLLSNKVESFGTLYIDGIYDNSPLSISATYNALRGNYVLGIPVANYDPNATYTVDYKILATIAPAVGTFTMQYGTDLNTIIKNVSEELNNKQTKNVMLDQIVDLSMLETGGYPSNSTSNNAVPSWVVISGVMYIQIVVPFKAIKATLPTVTLSNLKVSKGTSGYIVDITNLVTMDGIALNTQAFTATYVVKDTTAIADIKSYGALVRFDYKADCRGKV